MIVWWRTRKELKSWVTEVYNNVMTDPTTSARYKRKRVAELKEISKYSK